MEQENEKSQDATPYRRQQAREHGQVARSQDLGSSLLLVGGLAILFWFIAAIVDFFGRLMIEQLGGPAWIIADAEFVGDRWWQLMAPLAGWLVPVLGAFVVLAVIANVMQVGLLFLPDKLAPDLSRLDPIQGFARIVSLRSFARLFFGLIKIVIVGTVAYVVLKGERDRVLGLTELALPQLGLYLLQILYWSSMKIGVALLILALLDYGFQWWRQEQDLKMTTQEVREEMKNLQGDPQVIARRRAVQRQLIMHRLGNTVPKADVVITNPTELAIAIEYDPKTMAAPVVVAKGAGLLAQRIRRLALEHGIPIVEKKPLAQALYKDVELNRPIPSQMYAAVAEVLAYVYQLKGKKMPG